MFTLVKIIDLLFPGKNTIEIRNFIILAEKSVDFDDAEWLAVTKTDLQKEEIKMRLIKTLYEAQLPGQSGVIGSIMDSLEEWSGQLVIFVDWSDDIREFYIRFYALCGAMYFAELGYLRQQFLLHSQFLPLMLTLEESFYNKIKICFAEYCFVSLLKEQREQFQVALRTNRNQFLNNYTATVAEIITEFENFKFSDVDKVAKYLESKTELAALSAVEKKMMFDLLHIYNDLVKGIFETSPVKPLCTHPRIHPVNTTSDAEYIEVIKQAKNIEDWLKDIKEVSIWLREKPEMFVKELLVILKKKIKQADSEQMIKVLELTAGIAKKWDGLIYFDEKTGQFHWNEKLLE